MDKTKGNFVENDNNLFIITTTQWLPTPSYEWAILSRYVTKTLLYKKLSMKSYEDVSKQILSRSRNHNHFLMIFPRIASEIENVGPIFSSSNPEFFLIKL